MTSRINLPKTATAAMHTAGIFSDMTVDGPEIGDLVIIVDKAKNLPNRKTMGKQDPYCAARLGKEAKKTETDKRGGQTPKWDQELRFTVHDSADYYQLKVSVFNDDKKTDLIGEAWINLEKVVVRGGGRSDGWHALNCKGRYAGEIRIELTYYDIRPKAEKPVEPLQQSAERNGVEQVTLGGPRQPKQTKRRPLPTDPTGSSPHPSAEDLYEQGSPAAYAQAPPRAYPVPPEYVSGGVSNQPEYYQASRLAQHRSHASLMRESSIEPELQYRHTSPGAVTMAPVPQHASSYEHEQYNHPAEIEYETVPADQYATSHHDGSHSSRQQMFPEDVFQNRTGVAPVPLPLAHNARHTSPGALPLHSNSAPPTTHARLPQMIPSDMQPACSERNRTVVGASPSHLNSLQQSPQRYAEYETEQRGGRHSMQPTVEDETPPPPPTHRSSAHQSSARESDHHHHHYDPTHSPAPLHIVDSRHSVSPLSYGSPQPHRNSYAPSTSPASAHSYLQGGPSPTRGAYHEPRRGSGDAMGVSPVREGPGGVPASLVAGYGAYTREPVSQVAHEGRRSYDHQAEAAPAPLFNGPPTYARHSVPAPVVPVLPPVRRADEAPRSMHRASAPMIKPRAVSPNPRTPMRKSVSPQPSARSEERSMPFSPDAFDAFNPHAGSPASAGPAYSTPEGAKDAWRQHQMDAQREEGPIIGHDGREIDPSDHLPSDTWAPEPLRKTPQSGRGETRSRPSPQGAQPMPPSSRRSPRQGSTPQGTTAASYINSDEAHTPTSGTRNRLQKRGRAQASSPAVAVAASSPLAAHDSKRGTPASQPRLSTNAYPLREHENFGQSRSPVDSPYGSGARNSPAAPPIPAKIPLRAGRDDYSALSEELKSIDIGVGSGSGRRAMRRSQY